MKLFTGAIFALLTLIACNNEVPPKAAQKPQGIAENIAFHPGHMVANFENGEQATIYFKPCMGASVVLPAKGQFEIAGTFSVDKTGWYCLDNAHGEYIHVRRNGSASGKVRGMTFHLMPKTSKEIQ